MKPDNILIDADGHIKLTDFGYSKRITNYETESMYSNANTRSYSVVGQEEYMSPEVLNKKGHDEACDWWSLGIVLY